MSVICFPFSWFYFETRNGNVAHAGGSCTVYFLSSGSCSLNTLMFGLWAQTLTRILSRDSGLFKRVVLNCSCCEPLLPPGGTARAFNTNTPMPQKQKRVRLYIKLRLNLKLKKLVKKSQFNFSVIFLIITVSQAVMLVWFVANVSSHFHFSYFDNYRSVSRVHTLRFKVFHVPLLLSDLSGQTAGAPSFQPVNRPVLEPEEYFIQV